MATGTWGTCPWEIDADGVLSVHPGIGADTAEKIPDDDYYYDARSPWAEYYGSITSIRIVEEEGQKVLAPAHSSRLFGSYYDEDELVSLTATSIDLSGLDTSGVKGVDGMFWGCASLESLDVSGFNTSKMTDMEGMFSGCSSLRALELTNFDTSHVADMGNMFEGCSSLVLLDVSGFDTSEVTGMYGMYDMFSGCSSLTTLDLSGWDTSRVTRMGPMISGCSSLVSLDVSTWDTSSVTEMNSMFSECTSLTSLDVADWDTSQATDMNNMFSDCTSLTSLDVSGWDTSQVTDICGIFSGCSSLSSLNISQWDTSQVMDMGWMFWDCSSLKALDISRLDTSRVTRMTWMFYGCSLLTSLDVSGWDTSKVTDMSYMFSGCSSLTSLDVSGKAWDTINVTGMSGMFDGCSALARLRVGRWYKINGPDMFPDATSDAGEWWSTSDQTWYTKDEIVDNRSDVEDTYTNKVVREVVHFDQRTNVNVTETFRESLAELIDKSSSTTYSPELAYMLGSLASSAYRRNLVMDSLKNLGMKDVTAQMYDYYFNEDHWVYDYHDDTGDHYSGMSFVETGLEPDQCGFTISRTVTPSGRDVFVVVVRGTVGELLSLPPSIEWRSDVHLGLGITTKWHKGFSSASQTIYDALVSYEEKESEKGHLLGGEPIYVITGHSRGAAVGNLVAMRLNEAGVDDSNVFNYNFACPDVVRGSILGNGNHDNIFNISSQYDIISYLPGNVGNALPKARPLQVAVEPPVEPWGKFGLSRWLPEEAEVGFQFFDPTTYHEPTRYVEKLRQLPSLSSMLTYEQSVSSAVVQKAMKSWQYISAHCPVDVELVDDEGNVVASVIGGVADYHGNSSADIAIFVEGDEKAIAIRGFGDVHARLVGTDNGTMSLEMGSVELTGTGITPDATYENVALEDGKSMEATLEGVDESALVRLLVLDGTSDAVIAEVLPDGTERTVTDISNAEVTLAEDVWEYEAEGVKPGVTVTLDGQELVAGEDYRVTYRNYTVAGTATCVVTGIGAYAGTVRKSFWILPEGSIDGGTCGSFVWSLDAEGTLTIIGPGTLASNAERIESFFPWHVRNKQIMKVESTGAVALGEDSSFLFHGCSSLSDVSVLNAWDASSVVATREMFSGCEALEIIDLSEWNASSVTDLQGMYSGCDNLRRWSIGASYPLDKDGAIPAANAPSGKWWSEGAGAWFAVEQIPANRNGITDTYVNEGPEEVIDISDATVASIPTQTYASKALKPKPIVTLDGTTLVEGTDYELSWSDNVNAGTGHVTITGIGAYLGERTEDFTIAKAAQSIAASNKSVAVGKTVKLGAKTSGNGKLTYKSSNNAVAKVNASGVVTPIKPGSAKITITAAATANYKSATKTVTVTVTKGTQTITASNKAVKVKGTVKLGAKRTVGDGKLTYKSSNNAIATVSPTGVVTGVKRGKATIAITAAATTKYNKATKKITVVVKSSNTLTATRKKATVTASFATLKSKAVTLVSNVTVAKAQGTVNYANVSTSTTAKKFKVNGTTGKLTIPKGTKKGTYVVKVKVTAKGTTYYCSGSKTVTYNVTVK